MAHSSPLLTAGHAGYDDALLRIGKASKKTLLLYGEGIYLTASTARGLIDLQHQVCADRVRLARAFLVAGSKLLRSRPGQYRNAISRYYYSMYHAARAVVYFSHGGDDHEAHSVLPTKLPDDFVDGDLWQNSLKDARSRRNQADYDPYPTAEASWKPIATTLANDAPELVALAEQYLRAKGCTHI
jgi:uncharacterized protein (UPF0332 family)